MFPKTSGNSNALTRPQDSYCGRNQRKVSLEAFSRFVACNGNTVTGQKPYS